MKAAQKRATARS
uniref:Uncharacterized protein n=1 Tax=Arundo donax TaxID=35708 RepID=A0A0A9BJP2_ARUDO